MRTVGIERKPCRSQMVDFYDGMVDSGFSKYTMVGIWWSLSLGSRRAIHWLDILCYFFLSARGSVSQAGDETGFV